MPLEGELDERDRFFYECVQDYPEAIIALATFEDKAGEVCERVLRERWADLICYDQNDPVSFEPKIEHEKDFTEFSCGSQAKLDPNGPNVVCQLCWWRPSSSGRFRPDITVTIEFLKNS
jgi:hypothetical protein